MPFEKGSLSTKNRIKGKRGKIFAAAILSTWIRKEESGQENLIALLASAGVTIDKGNESRTSTINLVTKNEASAYPNQADKATSYDIHSTQNKAEIIPDNQ